MTKLEQVALAITDEAGGRLCKLTDDGKRICHRNSGSSVCLCESVARAAVGSLRDVSFSILGAEPLEWNDVIDLILNEKPKSE